MVVQTQRPPVPSIVTRDVDRLTSSVDGLQTIVRELREIIVGRPPIDIPTTFVSATMPWKVDYRDRKHVFIWLPIAATLSFEDWGTGPVQAQVWINLGVPQGTRMFAPNITGGATLQVNIRCTDEVIA